MALNIIVGAILAVFLLFDFVYLPLERDRTAPGPAKADRATARPDAGAAGPGSAEGRDGAASVAARQRDARAMDLERDLAAARDRLARADRDVEAARSAQRGAETARVAGEATLAQAVAQERRSATDLADRLFATTRAATAREEAFAARLAAEKARSSALERELAAARGALALADRDRAVAEAQLRSAARRDDAGPGDGLPGGMPARVVLLYPRASQTARGHAAALQSMLRSQGLEVDEPVARVPDNLPDSITYYFDDDRGSAERVATIVGASKPVKARIPKAGTVRPGRVEVSVAG